MLVSREVAGTLFVGGALAMTVGSLVYPAMLGVDTVGNAPGRIIDSTSTGPLTEADRDFVVKVRAARLWEYPVGRMALEKGTTKPVRIAGEHLIDGHASLDAACRRVAAQLDITLPNQATPQQQGFVDQLNADAGKQFDTDMANILRMTHAQIFPTIAGIRATTRNSLVRALADQANDTVLDHITVLEKTGLVDFAQANVQVTTSPRPSDPALTPPPPAPGAPVVTLTPRASGSAGPTAG
ncbi:DUF4142 domain-containing protein [Streptomyces sp. UG1]|uniref:DUF4142 domain-containing protein n=1 Tax=Streptomyces sp. UG1 TaxID=3417652 RepID=UPI003CEBAE94